MQERHIQGTTVFQFPILLILLVFSFVSLGLLTPGIAWAAPATPTNLTATMASSRQINLSWQDNATTETNYYVERSPNGSSSWTVIATLGANVVSYQSTSLTQNTIYYYRVRCRDGSAVYSSYSNTSNATTAILAAPTGLTATVVSASTISLTWTDVSYETQYSIERSPTGTNSWVVRGTVASNVTTTANSGLSVGTPYYYRIRAYDSTNYSAYSTVVNQTIRTIAASAGANGSISPSGTVGVASGTSKVFTMTPNTGYTITSVLVDGSAAATNPTYTFSNITANHTIASSFTDVTAPTGTITINNGAAYANSANVTLTLAAVDSGSGVSQVRFSNNGTTWSTPETFTSSKSWALSGGDGSKTVYAKFKDNSGNWSIAYSSSIIVDTQAPTLSLSTLPDNSRTNSSLVNVAGIATDNISVQNVTVTGVSISVNADNTFSQVITLSTGTNVITTMATDVAGNTSSLTRTIIRSSSVPAIMITNPADNSITSLGTLTITGLVSKTATVTAVVNGGAPLTATISRNAFSIPITLTNGQNTIIVNAMDQANKIGSVSRTVTYVTNGFSLAVTNPAQDLTTNQQNIVLQGSVSSLPTGSTVTIAFNGSVYTPQVISGLFEQALTLTSEKTYSVIVSADDGAGHQALVQRNIIYSTATQTLAINPFTMLAYGMVSKGYSDVISATGGTVPYSWSITSGTLPDALTLDQTTGVISGTPTSAGTYTITVQVVDANNFTDTKTVSILITETLVIPNYYWLLPYGFQGIPYNVTLTAAGGIPPYTWEGYSSFPNGMTLGGTDGVISGTPGDIGDYRSIVVQVKDSIGNVSDQYDYGIQICAPVSILTTTLPTGVPGTAYTDNSSTVTLAASGGLLSIYYGLPLYWIWSIETGTLPKGLTLDYKGDITGVPKETGTFPFTVMVADYYTGMTTTKALSITTLGVGIETFHLSGVIKIPSSLILRPWGGTTPFTWEILSGSLPLGFSLAPDTGVISGVTNSIGFYPVTVKVTDGAQSTSTKSLVMSISDIAEQWMRTDNLDGYLNDIAVDAGGNVYVTGTAWSSGDNHDCNTTKYDALGNMIWSKGTGSDTGTIPDPTGGICRYGKLAIDVNGNVFVAGYYYDYTTDAYVVAVIKYDTDGNLLWWNPNVQMDGYDGITSDGMGNAYLTGYLYSGNDEDIRTVKLSGTDGTNAWIWDYDNGGNEYSGGVKVGDDGAVYISGIQDNYVLIMKYDQISGTVVWVGTSEVGSLDWPRTMTLDSNGNVYAVWSQPNTANDFVLLKYDANGNQVWGTVYKGYYYDLATCIATDLAGNIYLSGESEKGPGGFSDSHDGFTLKYDPNGSLIWRKTWNPANDIGGSTYGGAITLDAEGNVYTAGHFSNNASDLSYSVRVTIKNYRVDVSITSTIASGTTGTSYSQALTATRGLKPYTWAITQGALPAGLGFNSNLGVISGTPTSAGTTTFTVQVADSTGITDTKTFALAVHNPLTITTSTLPAGIVGAAYSQTVTASGGSTAYLWSITTGMLPTGVSLDAQSGLISGSPVTEGTYTLTVKVADSDGRSAEQALVLTITPDVNPPTITLFKIDPYDIQLSYGEFSIISYVLSRDANVTVTLTPVTGTAITVINSQHQTAGAHEIQWNGLDVSDTSNKKLLIVREGEYSVTVQAANPGNAASSAITGILRVWR